jgi:hypothetical protein
MPGLPRRQGRLDGQRRDLHVVRRLPARAGVLQQRRRHTIYRDPSSFIELQLCVGAVLGNKHARAALPKLRRMLSDRVRMWRV